MTQEKNSQFNRLYIANQGKTSYMDEIRWLASAMRRKKNIALQGEPGNGKSSAIRFVADIFDRTVFARTCHIHEQEFDYQGRPAFSNGTTFYSDTELTSALRNKSAIFLNEESSEMPPHSQKSLSMLLTGDFLDFTVLDKQGNKVTLREMKDKHGWDVEDFVYAETFNPKRTTSGRDNFEFSHKSRCSPSIFNDIDSFLGAYVAFKTMGIDIDLPLEERGIIYEPKRDLLMYLEKNDSGNWMNIANKEVIREVGKLATYQYFNRENVKHDSDAWKKVKEQIEGQGDFYLSYLKFLTALRGVVNIKNITSGPDSLYQTISSEVRSEHTPEGNGISLVYPDQRTIEVGFQTYKDNLELFGDSERATHATTYEILDKLLHGALADKMISSTGTNQWSHLAAIATSYDLIPKPKDATQGV
ncbi:AAA domain-containing protein [archaeon]|jgi:hypothetical protein|nr:AAA domain-containing protein [archaeon]MBT3451492.1 AAA domain-containing protein [archaeon]MBT6869742.1 AAA domain-containing protein [archaeon]MBT7192697.1 AAA domain-containing protein [archaeon]MBT7380722.1 AAA domain-containing protein [archaeon]